MRKYFRDRKRNFVTAQTGFVGVCVLMISTIIFNFIYNFEFWTLDTYRLDSSTKASVSTFCPYELMVPMVLIACTYEEYNQEHNSTSNKG